MKDLFNHPLTNLWMERLIKKEELTTKDLIPYSLVSLRRKRMRKKFLKNPMRYVSDRTQEAWMGCVVGNFSGNMFIQSMDFKLEPILGDEEIGLPKGKIYYFDNINKQNGDN